MTGTNKYSIAWDRLSDAQIKLAVTDGNMWGKSLKDGGTLYMQVRNHFGLWMISPEYNGKSTIITLGYYPFVSLGKARGVRAQIWEALESGEDTEAVKNRFHVDIYDGFSDWFRRFAPTQNQKISQSRLADISDKASYEAVLGALDGEGRRTPGTVRKEIISAMETAENPEVEDWAMAFSWLYETYNGNIGRVRNTLYSALAYNVLTSEFAGAK